MPQLLLVGDGFGQVRNRPRLTPFHISAVAAAGGYIFINTVIALYQFGKSEIAQFSIGFGAAEISSGYEFLNRPRAAWAFFKLRVIDRLPEIENLPKFTWFF